MKQKLFRGIVLLFLIYTGVELAFPQFCGEKTTSIPGVSSVAFGAERAPADKTLASVSKSITSSPELALPGIPHEDRETPKDEDCFCCCAHVVPGGIFACPDTVELASIASAQHTVAVPTATLLAPYHPPRFA